MTEIPIDNKAEQHMVGLIAFRGTETPWAQAGEIKIVTEFSRLISSAGPPTHRVRGDDS